MIIKPNVTTGALLFRFRGILPVLFLLIGFLIRRQHWQWLSLPDTPILWLTLTLTGLFIRAYTVGHSPKGTSGRNTGRQLALHLNTSGSYSVCRNPLYTGNFLIWLSVALSAGSIVFLFFFCMAFFFFYQSIISEEERFLNEKYGEFYQQWKSKTPAFFPKWKLFRKPDGPFNRNKVIRKEKNGVAGICCSFFIMACADSPEPSISCLIHTHPGWATAALLSMVYYLTVKCIMRFTSLLG